MAEKKYDWGKLEIEFINSDGNLRKFAESHGIPYDYLRKVAIRKGWGTKWEQNRDKIITHIRERLAERLAGKYEKAFDKDKLWEGGTTEIIKAFEDRRLKFKTKKDAYIALREIATAAERLSGLFMRIIEEEGKKEKVVDEAKEKLIEEIRKEIETDKELREKLINIALKKAEKIKEES